VQRVERGDVLGALEVLCRQIDVRQQGLAAHAMWETGASGTDAPPTASACTIFRRTEEAPRRRGRSSRPEYLHIASEVIQRSSRVVLPRTTKQY
jgi:hypothetical protein